MLVATITAFSTCGLAEERNMKPPVPHVMAKMEKGTGQLVSN
jgi:hypothetical protein